MSYVEIGKTEGRLRRRRRPPRGPARRATTSPRPCSPTSPPDARIFQEEIFGPVVAITPFDTDEEALALANGIKYGLAAYVWTSDLTRAHNFAQNVEAGMVWLNSQQRPRPAHPVRRRQGLRPRPRGRLPLDRLLHRPAGRAHHPRRGAHARLRQRTDADAQPTPTSADLSTKRDHP